tara:strand:+ start:451 stop:645 length:195 start_codon:yes stop_codon:yes gene_type:complete
MNELRLPIDTPILHEEGLWELSTDRAYEMMAHRRQSLDDDVFYDQIKYWTIKIYQANLHLRGED